MGVLLPEVGCQAGGQGSVQAAATAAAGPGKGQAGGSPEGLAAGQQQQSAPLIFAGGRIQGWPGPFGQIPLAQPQRGVVWQGVQQGPGQTQVDSLQFPHRRQGLVLHQPALDQANGVGGDCLGPHRAGGPAAVGAEARGHIHSHQGPRPLPLAGLQQHPDPFAGGALLADAQ